MAFTKALTAFLSWRLPVGLAGRKQLKSKKVAHNTAQDDVLSIRGSRESENTRC